MNIHEDVAGAESVAFAAEADAVDVDVAVERRR